MLSHQNFRLLCIGWDRQATAAAPAGPGQAKAFLYSTGESPAWSYACLAPALAPSCTLTRSKVGMSHEGTVIKSKTSCQLSEVVLCLNLRSRSRSRHLSWLLQGSLSCYFWVGHRGGESRWRCQGHILTCPPAYVVPVTRVLPFPSFPPFPIIFS